MVRKRNKLICGIGINDADYITQAKNKPCCNIYSVWQGILVRCYSEKFQEKNISYIGCSICDEWLTFSVFREWMIKQDWRCKQIDKDILFQGNKLYSPETCLFVTHEINSLLTSRSNFRGRYPQGVSIDNASGRYQSQCRVKGKQTGLGLFSTPEEAHEVYKEFKYKMIAEIAEEQSEPLRSALLRYKII